MTVTSTRGKWTIDPASGKLIDYIEPPKPDVNAPYVVTDEIAALKNHADGRYYTSKAKMRDVYRRLGKVEIGTETDWKPKRDEKKAREERQAEIRAELERAYYDLRDNNAKEMDAETREKCKRIDHNLKHYNYDRRDYDRDGNPRE